MTVYFRRQLIPGQVPSISQCPACSQFDAFAEFDGCTRCREFQQIHEVAVLIAQRVGREVGEVEKHLRAMPTERV